MKYIESEYAQICVLKAAVSVMLHSGSLGLNLGRTMAQGALYLVFFSWQLKK